MANAVNAVSNKVVNADSSEPGIHAQTALPYPSLNSCYNEEVTQGYSLDELVGSWGVDLANEESWTIVNSGGGQFAVVPEPSTLLLLSAGLAGLLVYRVRKVGANRPWPERL